MQYIVSMYVCMFIDYAQSSKGTIHKGKGIGFIVLYPPKHSHDLPPLAGLLGDT